MFLPKNTPGIPFGSMRNSADRISGHFRSDPLKRLSAICLIIIALLTLSSRNEARAGGATTYTWTGAVSTEWNLAGNWSAGGPPTNADNASVPAAPSGGRFPTISNASGTVYCRDLTVASGAVVNMTGGTLYFYHDWKNSGSFNGTGGTVVFAGSAGAGANWTTAAVNQFYNIVINSGIDPGFDNAANGFLSVGGNWTDYNTGALSVTNSYAVTFNGSGNQVITTSRGTNNSFYILKSSSAGGTVSLANAVKTAGNFLVTGGTFNPGTWQLTIAGTFSTFSGGTIKVGAATFSLNYSKNPTPSAGTTVEYYSTAAQTVSNSFTYSNLTLSGSGTKTFAGNTTISSTLSINPTAKAGLPNGSTSTANLLKFNTIQQSSGSWGSSISPAVHKNDTYFLSTTTGIINVATGCFGPDIPTLSATVNPICNAGSSTISITSGNLNGAASWQWYTVSCGGTSAGSGTSIIVSPTATTTYYVRGEGGCVSTPGTCAYITITVSAIPVAVSASATPNPVCAGSTLTLTGTATGATTWSWTGPNGFTSTQQNPAITGITSAGAGIYTLVAGSVCGSAAAVNTPSVAVTPRPTVTTTQTNALCYGAANGSITATAGGGTSPYQFSKDNGTTFVSGSSPYTFSGLVAGTYNVITRDANGCLSVATPVVITQPAVLVATITPSATVIHAGTTGITYTVSSGMSGYSWNLSGGGTITAGAGTRVITVTWNTAGDYTVTVQYTNAQGCLATGTLAVTVLPSDTFAAGAYIIDAGQNSTINAGLKPYGLVYALLKAGIPVNWSINPAKIKDGVDFTLPAGKSYKGGPFIISADYASNPTVISLVATWRSSGAVVDGPVTAGFSAPVYEILTKWPKGYLDADNQDLITPYYSNAGVPTDSYRLNSSPLDLPPCAGGGDEVYILPHADPQNWTGAQVNALVNFMTNGGYLWVGCHAVSALDLPLPTSSPTIQGFKFLTTGGLVPWTNHDKPAANATYTYNPAAASDPVMQFIGTMDASMHNGSEEIYLPKTGSSWRSSTTVAVYNNNYTDAITHITYSYPANPATLVAYGRTYGDPAKGMVMYEAAHSYDGKGTTASQIATERAFFNFLLLAGTQAQHSESGPTTADAGPSQSICGSISAVLAANTPFIGSGSWSVTSGPSTLLSQFSSITDPAATFTPAGGNGAYILRWTITSGACTTTSDMTLTVNPAQSPPAIGAITQPTCSVSTGSVVLNGLPAGSWTINPGGIAGTGTITTLTGLDSGTYSFTVTNSGGCTSPASADVVINPHPQTPVGPDQAISILSGETFTITPEGVPPGTTYTWTAPVYTGGVTGGSAQSTPQSSISGTLSIPSGSGTATYTVTPTAGSCTGAAFTVTVTVTTACVPVSITSQPANGGFCINSGNASFTAGVSGTSPITFQWQYNNGGTWVNVADGIPAGAAYSNSTSATLDVTGISAAGIYQYHCVMTNCGGGNTATTSAATLTVNALPSTSAIYHR